MGSDRLTELAAIGLAKAIQESALFLPLGIIIGLLYAREFKKLWKKYFIIHLLSHSDMLMGMNSSVNIDGEERNKINAQVQEIRVRILKRMCLKKVNKP